MSNSSMIDRMKSKLFSLHRITIAAIILYISFVTMFVIVNVLMCIWNVKINRRKYILASKNNQKIISNRSCFNFFVIDVQIDQALANEEDMKHPQVQDEDQSENSFDEERSSFLDRLGAKIDRNLHRSFTSYVVLSSFINQMKNFVYFSVSADSVLTIQNIQSCQS